MKRKQSTNHDKQLAEFPGEEQVAKHFGAPGPSVRPNAAESYQESAGQDGVDLDIARQRLPQSVAITLTHGVRHEHVAVGLLQKPAEEEIALELDAETGCVHRTYETC